MANKMRRDTLRRWVVSGIAAALLAALYGIIFRFSAQDGEQSGSLSQEISARCVDILNSLSGGDWSEARMSGLAAAFEHPIRKLAHFSEYACMGILVYTLLSQWMRRGRGRCLLTVDVLLDTCGGAFGMLLCICAAALWRRHGAGRKAKAARGCVEERD